MKLLVDNRCGVHDQDQVFEDVCKEDAVEKLCMLDGRKHTLIALDRPDGSQLMIGGGPDWFVVTLSEGRSNLTLCNEMKTGGGVIELCAGGQYGEFPDNLCVDGALARGVVNIFFDGKERQIVWV